MHIILAATEKAELTQIFKLISIIGFSLAAIFLVLSIAFFFLYDIKSVYAFLSGRKQQKGVSEISKEQEGVAADESKRKSKSFLLLGLSKNQGSKPAHSAKVAPPVNSPLNGHKNYSTAAGRLDAPTPVPPVSPPQPVYQNAEAGTDVLSPANNPAVAAEAGTDVLSPANNPAVAAEAGTDVLSPANNPAAAYDTAATDMLSPNDPAQIADKEKNALKQFNNSNLGSFILVKNEIVIHTDEVL